MSFLSGKISISIIYNSAILEILTIKAMMNSLVTRLLKFATLVIIIEVVFTPPLLKTHIIICPITTNVSLPTTCWGPCPPPLLYPVYGMVGGGGGIYPPQPPAIIPYIIYYPNPRQNHLTQWFYALWSVGLIW